MKTAHENELSKALEFIKSKHNGEIPYKYGSMECAKLMTQFASQFREPSTEQSGGTEQEERIKVLEEALRDCIERMDRGRSFLVKDWGEQQWQVFNTDKPKEVLYNRKP